MMSIMFTSITYIMVDSITKRTITAVTEHHKEIHDLVNTANLDGDAKLNIYDDEVLTQAARNYAFTNDEKWYDTYNESAIILDELIKRSINEGSDEDKNIFTVIDTANIALVKMETESMELTKNGQNQRAIEILDSPRYWEHKTTYKSGLDEFYKNKSQNFNDAHIVIDSIDSDIAELDVLVNANYILFGFFIVISLIGVIISALIISKSVSVPIKSLIQGIVHIQNKNYDFVIKSQGAEEFHKIIDTFNNMMKKSKELENIKEILVVNETVKKLLEEHVLELEDIDKQKDDFSNMINHELKTPLVPIITYCKMFKKSMFGKTDKEQTDAITVIEKNAKRLDSIISDIIDMRKIVAKQIKFEINDLSLDEFFSEVESDYEKLLENDCQITYLCEKNLSIKADKSRLRQVYDKLLDNAISFTTKNDRKIEIGCKKEDKEIIFYIKDNGSGIAKDKQDNLLKKYTQENMGITRKHGGIGLSLVICKGIVEGMGGRIWIESKQGKGTSVYFTLPKNN